MTKKKICPRCLGNGYFKVKKSADKPMEEIIVQCPHCKSEGEITVTLDENLDVDKETIQ